MMVGLPSKYSLVESSYSNQIPRKWPQFDQKYSHFCTGAFLLCRPVAYKAVNDKKFQFVRIHRFHWNLTLPSSILATLIGAMDSISNYARKNRFADSCTLSFHVLK
jgi:hypothetical protein